MTKGLIFIAASESESISDQGLRITPGAGAGPSTSIRCAGPSDNSARAGLAAQAVSVDNLNELRDSDSDEATGGNEHTGRQANGGPGSRPTRGQTPNSGDSGGAKAHGVPIRTAGPPGTVPRDGPLRGPER